MIYTVSQLDTVIKLIGNPEIVKSRKIGYYNIPCAFDIETSSWYEENLSGQSEKRACMYIWMFSLNGYVIIGRTWSEFDTLISKLATHFDTSSKQKLIIYVHNLAYEFQFICNRYIWDKVFAVGERKPIYATMPNGIEFRCSYLLSGYSLEKVGENLTKYKVKKLVGNLDYHKIRHSKTPLTESEIEYCVNDVLVVTAYIRERIEADGDISKIPLTNTGYVRNFCREKCFYNGNAPKSPEGRRQTILYHSFMKTLTLEPSEYVMLKQAFQGGFTHANSWYVGKLLPNIRSYDFTSSYPAVMISEKFPMSKGVKVKIESKRDLEYNLKRYCCLFTIEFTGIRDIRGIDNPISYSRCIEKPVNAVINNGRVVSADRLVITITDVDYKILKRFYAWDSQRIKNFIRYEKGYLPKPIIQSILALYQDKTELKGIAGLEAEYLLAKGMLNSIYGMCVTDICRDEYIFNGEWDTVKIKQDVKLIAKSITKYNKSYSRFLFYPWGVWVTAYARYNLFTGIDAFSEDYVYSDTDSVKVMNAETHSDYIKWYNQRIIDKITKVLNVYNIDLALMSPKGKQIGVWDDEGEYEYFKTLGAKRYMTYKNGKLSLTVAGLGKKSAHEYLTGKYNSHLDIFEMFSTAKFYIPRGHAGKQTHTYIDEYTAGRVADYLGNIGQYEEFSSIHLEETDYNLTLADDFIQFLANFRTNYQ